jgi:hypothetical protein
MNASPDPATAQRRGRRIFLLIALVFALPVAAAWLIYFAAPELIPQERTNRGQLIQPAQPVETLSLRNAEGEPVALDRRWSLLVFDDGDCGAECARALLMTRQMRLSLNTRMKRLERVLVVPADSDLEALHELLDAAHPDLTIARDVGGNAQELFGAGAAFAGEAAPGLHLVDPHANYMMRYPAGIEPKPLREDIVRLLRASQIG